MIEAARVRHRSRVATTHWDIPWAALKVVVMKTRGKVHCTQGELAHRREIGCGHLSTMDRLTGIEEIRGEDEQSSKMELHLLNIGNFF
jgi:hypothetical protein